MLDIIWTFVPVILDFGRYIWCLPSFFLASFCGHRLG